jgi:hypothetical protein
MKQGHQNTQGAKSPNDPSSPTGGSETSQNANETAPPPVRCSAWLGVSVALSGDGKTASLSVPDGGYTEMTKDQLVSLNYACAKTLQLMSQESRRINDTHEKNPRQRK